ncbi:zinc-binding dehydrogenase [Pedobacter alpinus]|uniref:Zinc-binding dehydrogenase n=1 Tax=Pedobacter alpinus TaxID=1590643 RepID=A0ABW5TS36_9SPHI
MAGLNVIATASRPESAQWCTYFGADVTVNPHDLVNNMKTAGYPQVDFILDFVDANAYWDAMVELIKPQGHIASITGSNMPIALNKL